MENESDWMMNENSSSLMNKVVSWTICCSGTDEISVVEMHLCEIYQDNRKHGGCFELELTEMWTFTETVRLLPLKHERI